MCGDKLWRCRLILHVLGGQLEFPLGALLLGKAVFFGLIKYLQWWCDMLSLDAALLEQIFVLLGFRQAVASELFF